MLFRSVTNTLYAEYGRIANLTVSELSTAWKKITNYLASDTSDVNYLHLYEQYAKWITAETDGSATEAVTDYDDNPLYWTDETHTGMTTTENANPVLVYVYTELVKRQISFADIDGDGTENPTDIYGAGNGTGNNGKMIGLKELFAYAFRYYATGSGEVAAGDQVALRFGEDGLIASNAGAKVSVRNIGHLDVGDALPDTLEDGDLVFQGFTVSDKKDISAAATLYVQVDGLPEPTFVRFTGTTYSVALPSDAGLADGVEMTFKNRASGTVTLTGTVDGATNYDLTTGSFCRLRYNGTDWDRVG